MKGIDGLQIICFCLNNWERSVEDPELRVGSMEGILPVTDTDLN